MAIQFSIPVRNAQGDSIETAVGASPTLELRTTAQPANCAAADTGALLATLALPADWLTAAANGAKAINGGPWQVNATGTGVAAHYRIKQGLTCHIQGSVTLSGAGGDIQLVNTNIAAGQPVEITAFNVTMPNA